MDFDPPPPLPILPTEMLAAEAPAGKAQNIQVRDKAIALVRKFVEYELRLGGLGCWNPLKHSYRELISTGDTPPLCLQFALHSPCRARHACLKVICYSRIANIE
jgi:hypothetical protein